MQGAEIVISRFCEDLTWAKTFQRAFPTTIYDKSESGPRQRIHLPGWSSADGPPSAPLWPGAIRLPNVGCESHTHMEHIVRNWHDLADVTVFLSGDAPGHLPDIVQRVVADLRARKAYVPYGDPHSCDRTGRPHAPDLKELPEAWRLFLPDREMPETLYWHGFGMYLVARDRITRYSLRTWERARIWCDSKACSLGMERIYDTIFGDEAPAPSPIEVSYSPSPSEEVACR